MRRTLVLAAVAFALPFSAAAAEVRAGDYSIHYNALAASALPAAAAASYGISRGRGQGLLIVTVLDAAGDNVAADVRARATTLLGRDVPLVLRTFDEAGNHSTLASFALREDETLRFELDVTPPGGTAHQVRFVQEFVRD